MTRAQTLLGAIVVGVIVVLTSWAAVEPAPPGRPAALSSQAPRASAPDATAPPTATVLLIWTPHHLPTGFASAVARLPQIDRSTVVLGDLVRLVRSTDAQGAVVDRTAPGYAIPLDALAVDPHTFPRFVKAAVRPLIRGLAPNEVLLSETSAQLRRIGAGGTLELDNGRVLRVAAVVDDVTAAGAELVLPQSGARRAGVETQRYLLVRPAGPRPAVTRAIIDALPRDTGVRVRAPGEMPFLRHADTVLPMAGIKRRFGEFAYAPDRGRDVVIEQSWVDANVVVTDLPLLGRVRCHREFAPIIAGALRELRRRGLGHLIDTFAGCWYPRLTGTDPLAGVSRHAWGIAADFNAEDNGLGERSTQDPRLVEVMERWGMGWGGDWLYPDAMHFEYLTEPEPQD